MIVSSCCHFIFYHLLFICPAHITRMIYCFGFTAPVFFCKITEARNVAFRIRPNWALPGRILPFISYYCSFCKGTPSVSITKGHFFYARLYTNFRVTHLLVFELLNAPLTIENSLWVAPCINKIALINLKTPKQQETHKWNFFQMWVQKYTKKT